MQRITIMAQLALISGHEGQAAMTNRVPMDAGWSLPSGTACCALIVLSVLGWAAVLLAVAP